MQNTPLRSISTRNEFLERFETLDKKTFTHKGKTYKVYFRKSLAIYPYKHYSVSLDLRDLNCENEFCFTSLENPDTFAEFGQTLEKMLAKEVKRNNAK